MLSVARVSHRFGGLAVLRNVSFAVGQGERVGIVGPNGSGKTTLLNLLTGLYRPNSGRIRFLGEDLAVRHGCDIAALGIGRTFQAPRLFGSLTVEQHPLVAWPGPAQRPTLAALFRCGEDWRVWRTVARPVLARVGLDDLRQRLSHTLPYGRQRLLEIGRCLAREPRLLLLDEPTAGLNHDEAAEVHRLLVRENESSGVALLIVEHNLEFLRALCPRLVALDRGEVVADGATPQVLEHPQVVDGYLGGI